MKEESPTLFDNLDDFTDWSQEWQDMPEFIQQDKMPYRTIYVHFENEEAVQDFAKVIQQNITCDTRFVWHPKAILQKVANKRYSDEK